MLSETFKCRIFLELVSGGDIFSNLTLRKSFGIMRYIHPPPPNKKTKKKRDDTFPIAFQFCFTSYFFVFPMKKIKDHRIHGRGSTWEVSPFGCCCSRWHVQMNFLVRFLFFLFFFFYRATSFSSSLRSLSFPPSPISNGITAIIRIIRRSRSWSKAKKAEREREKKKEKWKKKYTHPARKIIITVVKYDPEISKKGKSRIVSVSLGPHLIDPHNASH